MLTRKSPRVPNVNGGKAKPTGDLINEAPLILKSCCRGIGGGGLCGCSRKGKGVAYVSVNQVLHQCKGVFRVHDLRVRQREPLLMGCHVE